MGMHFSEKRGREYFLSLTGGEKNLRILEEHFKKWPFSKKEDDVLKRFFVKEPAGRQALVDYLKKHPGTPLQIKSFELLPTEKTLGMSIYWSSNYNLLEDVRNGLILVEHNTALMDLMKYVF